MADAPEITTLVVVNQPVQAGVRLLGFVAADNPAVRTTDLTFTGQGVGLPFSASSPTIATSGNTTLSAAEAANPIVKLGSVTLAADVTVTFPNAQGFWIVDASGINLNTHLLKFVSGSTTSAAVTPSATAQLFFVATYGSNTISVK